MSRLTLLRRAMVMSDYTKLPHDIADCMKRAGSPLSEDQKLLLAGYLAPVQQKLADCEARVAELEDKNAKFAVALKEKMILTEGAYILRKQAEAVEEIVDADPDGRSEDGSAWISVSEIWDYAQSLRQQADEAERAGGEK